MFNILLKKVGIEVKNAYNQYPPLHEAKSKGYLPIVQYLIGKGTNIEAKDKGK